MSSAPSPARMAQPAAANFARRAGAVAGLDRINAALQGPVRLNDTRADLDASGKAQIKANSVNRV